MFRISEFARLAQVSLKTLHHYDDIGLFKPAHVDRFTGYRYYTYDQLPRLNRILVLKGLGFSLEAIRQMADGDLNPLELRGMLCLRNNQLQQQVADSLAKIRQIEIRLQQIEHEGNMPKVDVLVKSVKSMMIVGAREVVPAPALMRERCMALNDMACALMNSAALKSDGISMALYYSGEQNGIDVEMAYMIEPPSQPIAQKGKASVHLLPAAQVAYAVYQGSYDDFGAVGQVHAALRQWIEENSYRLVGPSREFYLRPPAGPQDMQAVMEIQYPVER